MGRKCFSRVERVNLSQEGVASLDEYLRLVDLRNAVRPVFRMVLTAVGDYAYQRPDGVIVCPISALKP